MSNSITKRWFRSTTSGNVYRSKKVLLCWELGGGSGHLVCLIRLATALAGRGHRPLLALDRVQQKHPVVTGGPAIELIEAPSLSPDSVDSSFHARSFADILGHVGFADAQRLKERIDRWRAIIRAADPAVILCDFSPFVCMAAKGLAPTVSVGSGFATPPNDVESFPTLNQSVAPTYDYDQLSNIASSVARECGIDDNHDNRTLVSLTSGDEGILRCYPLFDPYQAFSGRTTFGSIDAVSPIKRWRNDQWPRQFYAYLSGDYPGTLAIIEALTNSKCAGQIFVSSATASLVNAISESHLLGLSTTPQLAQVLPNVSLVIHHGGLGTAQACAAAGIPQLVIPRHLEQELTGASVLRNKIGACLIPPYSQEDVVRGVNRLMTLDAYRTNAQRVAEQIAQAGPNQFTANVIERVENS